MSDHEMSVHKRRLQAAKILQEQEQRQAKTPTVFVTEVNPRRMVQESAELTVDQSRLGELTVDQSRLGDKLTVDPK